LWSDLKYPRSRNASVFCKSLLHLPQKDCGLVLVLRQSNL